jgi:hypothetical protein
MIRINGRINYTKVDLKSLAKAFAMFLESVIQRSQNFN